MRYLGLDVHAESSAYCLLDANSNQVEHGKVSTSALALQQLARRLSESEPLTVGQEVGTMCHFVHDTIREVGVDILSFNAHQLRMIASSRKKTDKRDAFWIAKALASGMTPHPVYIPDAKVRVLRSLLQMRKALTGERNRWQMRARSALRGAGVRSIPRSGGRVAKKRMLARNQREGLDAILDEVLALCQRQQESVCLEISRIEKRLQEETKDIDDIQRLQTIPAVGEWTSIAIYAWIGDIKRFPNARELCSYVGMVSSVSQSGNSVHYGSITKLGTKALRSILVQAGHVLLSRCKSEQAAPLRACAARIHKTRSRRKVAVVAAGRHILRTAFYILRDGTRYNPALLRSAQEVTEPAA
jgi:transposase